MSVRWEYTEAIFDGDAPVEFLRLLINKGGWELVEKWSHELYPKLIRYRFRRMAQPASPADEPSAPSP
jgi:hypothetical protein